MRLCLTFLMMTLSISIGYCQLGFQMETNKNKVVIPFQLINNLIFIPITVNGEELTFLLDTGVEQTVLFSLDDKEDVSFFNVKKIKLKGLGSSDAIEALKSSNNRLKVKEFIDNSHDIYIILNQEFNFSSQVGIPVNGIIGFHFFKNHLVEINYIQKKIIVYKNHKKIRKRLQKSFFSENISLENNKPYLISQITFHEKPTPSKMLLDTGNSDGLWVFRNSQNAITLPDYVISDYLGRGFSGNVYGERGRITALKFGNTSFKKPIATFPDSTSTKDVAMVEDRIGSLGGEVLKRFSIVFDYNNNKIYSKPNTLLNEPFSYNMSGIEVQHEGLEWVKGNYTENPTLSDNLYDNRGEKINNNLKFKFELKPVFTIYTVRVGSPAEKAGLLKGDKILKINHSDAHSFSLEKINQLLKSEEGKIIEMELERNKKILKIKFQLKNVL